MPAPTIASYFMLLIDTRRWILRTPSQCSTSGISSWKRMSCTPATHSVRSEVCVGAVAALLALARVVDEELRHFAERAAFLAAVDDEPDAAGLRAADALLDRVRQVRPARADVGAEHVGAVALVVHARGERDVGIGEIARIAEHVDGLAADRRQEHFEIAARDELREHAAGLLEQRAPQIGSRCT